MPTPTYTPLANITLGSATGSVTFSSIPATYRDLIIVGDNLKTTSSTASVFIRFNGATANYTGTAIRGNGTDTAASNNAGQTDRLFSNLSSEPTTTTASNFIFQIMDYSATDKHKTTIHRGNNSADATEAGAGRYASTSAITSVQVGMDLGLSFAAGGTFALYGIAS
jgi:hypothetical protein